MLYTEQSTLRKIFENEEIVQEYIYFNNTGEPDEISDEEWEQRAEDWDKLGYDPVCLNSLSYDVSDSLVFFSFTYPMIKKELSEEKIIQKCAETLSLERYFQENPIDKNHPIKSYREFEELDKQGNFENKKQNLRDEVAPKIKQIMATI